MLIGIDLGTTALKVAAFDARNGGLLAGVSQRLRVDVGPPRTRGVGRREQDPSAVTRALRKALLEVGEAVGGLARARGVGLAAQGGSTIIARRDSGRALTPMVDWNDMRAFPHLRALSASRSPRYWRSFSLRDEPGMGLARIQWLRRESPEVLDVENIYAGAGEYVYFRLTGEWRQDACNAMQIGCYDARRRRLDGRPAKLVDVPLSFFAPLRQGHETHSLSPAAAKRFGLPAGIPVAGPYMDHEAGFLSAAHVSRKPLQCSLGTAWVGNFQLPDTSAGHSPFQFAIPSPVGKGRLVIQPLLTGNVTWDWALETFVDENHQRALAKQAQIFAESILPPEALVALPWLNRPNPLRMEKNGGCCFVGAGPSTTKADFLRAVAAGMCYELARVFDEAKERKAFDSVVLSGGASKGCHFQQLITALFGPLPVYQIEDEAWMGARGCLRPFSAKAFRAKARRLEPSGELDTEALRFGQGVYREAFTRFYGKVPAGRAFSFGAKRGKR